MASFDYADVVADLRAKAELLTRAADSLESLMGTREVAIREVAATPAVEPPKPAAIEKHRLSRFQQRDRANLPAPPDDDVVDSKLTVNQAVLRALYEKPLSTRELKYAVFTLRPGTTSSVVDSAVCYLKAREQINKSQQDGLLHVRERFEKEAAHA